MHDVLSLYNNISKISSDNLGLVGYLKGIGTKRSWVRSFGSRPPVPLRFIFESPYSRFKSKGICGSKPYKVQTYKE